MKLINLLPKARQSDLRQEVFYHNFLAVIWISLLTFIMVVVVQFLVHLFLIRQSSLTKQSINDIRQQVNRQDNAKVKTEIAGVNNYIDDFKDLSNNAPHWSQVLKAFAPIPPAGVKINSLTVDSTRRLVTITGFSPSRDLVIKLYNNILNSKDFENVDYPLENVAQPTDITFHFSFNVKDYLLK